MEEVPLNKAIGWAQSNITDGATFSGSPTYNFPTSWAFLQGEEQSGIEIELPFVLKGLATRRCFHCNKVPEAPFQFVSGFPSVPTSSVEQEDFVLITVF
ncbi:MAG: hypothetical protein GY816_24370 [Cytophagales bacterium]|nr:hypothetical protein [Cytophagales bacterium]